MVDAPKAAGDADGAALATSTIDRLPELMEGRLELDECTHTAVLS